MSSPIQTRPESRHRWLVLATVALAQLMVVLDATIVNIALPSAQADLGFSDNDRQWVVTAYALAFGSLLLLGGRLADMFGRRRMFLIGLVGFAVASALGGAAQSFELLVGARALQGAFAAVLAPAALSVLTTTFTIPKERARAFGVFGAIAGMGGAIGLLLAFVLRQRTAQHPLLPLSIVQDRDRGAGFLAILVAGSGMFGVFLFLTYYLQLTLGYTPMQTGTAFLPMVVFIVITAQIQSNILVPRFGPKILVPMGMLLGASAMLWFTT